MLDHKEHWTLEIQNPNKTSNDETQEEHQTSSECRMKKDLNKGRAHACNIDEGTYKSMFLSCQITKETINNKDIWLLDSCCSNHSDM